MLISEALSSAENSLKQKGVDSSRIDALLILCHCLDVSKEQIIFNGTRKLDSYEKKKLSLLLKRRENREPMSHILGKREFFGLDFFVNSSVLDPRPDSETIIEAVLEVFTDRNKPIKILELGVGSGCLFSTILKYLPNSSAIGSDISSEALNIAQNNVDQLNLSSRVNLIQSNWFSNIEDGHKFDLIISNPPYIKTSDIDHLQDEVKNFEPHLALDGGKDGLNCYRDISAKAADFLTDSGFVLLEIGQNQENEVIEIFTKNNLRFVKSKKDLPGIIRCLVFMKK
ncbi:MAG: release factor glutamine methyltransferase [Rickettsiales bacterium]|jgi:release factor glutamine methyltransferase